MARSVEYADVPLCPKNTSHNQQWVIDIAEYYGYKKIKYGTGIDAIELYVESDFDMTKEKLKSDNNAAFLMCMVNHTLNFYDFLIKNRFDSYVLDVFKKYELPIEKVEKNKYFKIELCDERTIGNFITNEKIILIDMDKEWLIIK